MKLAMALMVAVALPMEAQQSTRPVQVIVSGGMSLPTGKFKELHDTGIHADVSLLLSGIVQSLKLRPELSFSRFKLKDLQSLGAASSSAYGSDYSSLLGGFANIEIPLGRGGFQPFVLAGVGAVQLKTDATAQPESFSEVKASLNFGAGFRFKLGAIAGFFEGRLNNVPSDAVKTTFKEARYIPVTFGLVF